MGKTFRRGGSESGNYSYGKSIRDKRQRGTNRTSQGDYSHEYQSKGKDRRKKKPRKRKYEKRKAGIKSDRRK